MANQNQQNQEWPSTTEMQTQLRQTGALISDPPLISPSTPVGLSSSPTDANSKKIDPPDVGDQFLANTPTTGYQLADEQARHWFDWWRRRLPKWLAIGITLQMLWAIYHSLDFIFVRSEQLEQALQAGLVDQAQINQFTGSAIINTVSVVISLFFAMRLAFLKSKAAHVVHIITGLGIMVGNGLIMNYLNQLNSGLILAEYSSSLLEKIWVKLVGVMM